MKNVVIIVIVVLLALVAFNYFTTGEIKLIPSGKKLSPEEQRVADLESEFEAARTQYMQALRAAGAGGIDTTADAEGALRIADRIESEAKEMRSRLSPDAADSVKTDLDRLVQSIKSFKNGVK